MEMKKRMRKIGPYRHDLEYSKLGLVLATFLLIKVIPKASKSEIVGWQQDRLKIRLKALPEKGAANEELIRFLAEVLEIAKSQIELVSGESGRNKRIKIAHLTEEEVLKKIVTKNNKKLTVK